MAQICQCDICGRTVPGAQAPQDWGYLFRPMGVTPAIEAEAAKLRQRKDLCPGCVYSLEKLIVELRERLKRPEVSEVERDKVVHALLTTGKESK